MMPGSSRRTQVTPFPGPRTAVVALPAEIDVTGSGLVEAELTSGLAGRPAVLIADGTETAFCDSSGIAALVRAHHQAAAAGAQLRVVITSAPVRRILQLTGTDQLLLVYPSLAAAQEGSSPQPPPPAAAGPNRGETA
jgi:anti-anti-sigma factor